MTQRNGWLVIFAIAFTGETARAQCADWTAEFALPGTGNWGSYEEATIVYDDGTGPALYVGCGSKAAGLQVNGIARWNGTEWSALGTGLVGYGGLGGPRVHGLAAFDDGSGMALYAAGFFDSAGGVAAENLARWDGTGWSAVGTGLTASGHAFVWDIVVWDDGSGPALYAAGSFTAADGVPAANLARWNGTTWSEVGGGLDDAALDLEVFDGELHLAGVFTAAGGVPAPGLARWDGATWTPLVGGMAVESGEELGTWDDGSGAVLVASSSESIAQWDGTAWTSMGGGFSARDFEVYDDGSGPALYMADDGGPYRWNGSAWVQVGGGVQPEGPYDLAVYDEGNGPRLFVFGPLDTAGPSSTLAGGSARWEGGTSWSAIGPTGQGLSRNGLHGSAGELHVADLGNGSRLYVGGMFDKAGETEVSGVAAWDGTAWSPVGSITSGPNPGSVSALQAWDDGNGLALFAGGAFSWIGVSALNMARWNGVSWANIGDFNGSVADLELFTSNPGGERLYAAGAFIAIEGVPMERIARWKSNAGWLPLNGGGLDKPVGALVVFDDGNGPALFAGGNFTTAGTTAVSKIARYDGTSWSDVGGGVAGGNIYALCVHDDGSGPALFAAGRFTSVGTTGAAYIAKWDGTAWSSLAGGNPDGPVYALASHDEGDGRGPGLYAGGEFTAVGGAAASRMARWDATGWTPFSGPDADVLALTSFDDGGTWPALFVAGDFDVPFKAAAIARWSNSCPCQGTSYCTAGTTTNGCNALISSTGSASRSLASGFDVSVLGVEGEKQGLVFFGMSGGKAMPWGTGTSYFCVKGPSTRTNVQGSGGNSGQCDGTFALDFNAWMAANPAKAPPPGGQVWMQSWFRDPPAPKSTSLSDALTFSVCP